MKTFNVNEQSMLDEQMMGALLVGDLSLAAELLVQGASPFAELSSGETALMLAASQGSSECLRMLIPLSDVQRVDHAGLSALDRALVFAAGCPELDPSFVECLAMLAPLSNLSSLDKGGDTPLIRAAASGCLSAVSILLAAGADPRGLGRDGRDALMAAALHKHLDVVKALSSVCDANLASQSGVTALGLGCRMLGSLEQRLASVEIAKTLFPLCDPRRPTSDGYSLLLRAISSGYISEANGPAIEMVKLLIPVSNLEAVSPESGGTALHAAAKLSSAEVAKLLLAAGANPDALDRQGFSPLLIAVGESQMKCIEALAPASSPCVSGSMAHPMVTAAARADLHAVAALLPWCDPSARNPDGRDALMAAADAVSMECIELLLPHCDLSLRDARGMCAAEIARKMGAIDEALLIEAYAAAMAEKAELSCLGISASAPLRAARL